MAKGALWRHRDFRLLWGGETVSELGAQVSLLAIPLLAGAWVDRVRRRRLMIGADLGRTLALGSVPVAYAAGWLTLAQLYVVTLASGVLTVFFDVAYQSLLPSLVGREHLVEGNAKLTGSEQAATVAAPSLAGWLVQAVGSAVAVAADAASFVVSALALVAVRAEEPRPAAPAGGHRPLRHDIAEGLRFVFASVPLRAIAASTATSNLFSGIAAAVEVVFLVREVHASPAVIGLLFTAGGVGGVLGALTAGRLATRVGAVRATILGAAAGAGHSSCLSPRPGPGWSSSP